MLAESMLADNMLADNMLAESMLADFVSADVLYILIHTHLTAHLFNFGDLF